MIDFSLNTVSLAFIPSPQVDISGQKLLPLCSMEQYIWTLTFPTEEEFTSVCLHEK